uniref:Phostensin domain-containing protein n=1 Tax=Steinernema glaseri TaxID=37863 RepID=A0A1I8AN26_9BILA
RQRLAVGGKLPHPRGPGRGQMDLTRLIMENAPLELPIGPVGGGAPQIGTEELRTAQLNILKAALGGRDGAQANGGEAHGTEEALAGTGGDRHPLTPKITVLLASLTSSSGSLERTTATKLPPTTDTPGTTTTKEATWWPRWTTEWWGTPPTTSYTEDDGSSDHLTLFNWKFRWNDH